MLMEKGIINSLPLLVASLQKERFKLHIPSISKNLEVLLLSALSSVPFIYLQLSLQHNQGLMWVLRAGWTPCPELRWRESPGQGGWQRKWSDEMPTKKNVSHFRGIRPCHCLCGTWLEMTVQKMRAGTLCTMFVCQFLNPHRRQKVTVLLSWARASRQAWSRTFHTRSRVHHGLSIVKLLWAFRLLRFG